MTKIRINRRETFRAIALAKVEISVVFDNDKLKEAYEKLPEADPLRKRIDYVIGRIKEKPAFGQPIAKRLIPKEYRKKGVDNAFWVELSKGKGSGG